jgi:hypothetical protein
MYRKSAALSPVENLSSLTRNNLYALSKVSTKHAAMSAAAITLWLLSTATHPNVAQMAANFAAQSRQRASGGVIR